VKHTSGPATIDVTVMAASWLEHLEGAWNQADGAAFGAVFADDCDFVDIRGAHHRSRAAVSAGHQALFDSIYSRSSIRYQLDSAREVAPGCVVAVANATLNAPVGPLRGVSRARLTAVLTEHQGLWSVAAFHNTLEQQGTQH
jgi:uncharacterized protein (TIGR02246 family)